MNLSVLLGWFGLTEILIILGIVILLFGGRKLPELMKGVGKGIREFKDNVKPDEENKKEE